MKYVQHKDFYLNPRKPIKFLDQIVNKFSRSRYTFTEREALEEIWNSGEDVRLREDPRFWEIYGLNHFHLSNQCLANELLVDRLWKGMWNGQDLEEELSKLDSSNKFYVFCPADARFTQNDKALMLTARPIIKLPTELQQEINIVLDKFLHLHQKQAKPLTTHQINDKLVYTNEKFGEKDNILDILESCLYQRSDWSEIARSLWLPTSLVPKLDLPKHFRVLQVNNNSSFKSIEVIENNNELSISDSNTIEFPDPPIEKHLDTSISWVQVLRTIHIYNKYLPVPTQAQFRYPKFVGHKSNVIAVKGVFFDTGEEDFLWLDIEQNRFFGEFLTTILEWETSGRKLHLTWSAEAIVIKLGEIDRQVQLEEARHIDPESLQNLRLKQGESYRKTLSEILCNSPNGLDFRALYEKLSQQQNHYPNRNTIRIILAQSPEFIANGNIWKWQEKENASQVLNKFLTLADLANKSGKEVNNLADLADAVSNALKNIVNKSDSSKSK